MLQYRLLALDAARHQLALAVRKVVRLRVGSKRGWWTAQTGVIMTENGNEDCSPAHVEEAYIDDADRALTPYGRQRHGYMHAAPCRCAWKNLAAARTASRTVFGDRTLGEAGHERAVSPGSGGLSALL